ncbi:hypothetical protein BDZ97DRAFT_1051339 [Flammula alnicola]|nr:hypothetical protein BDZ97DRAFT_1051339 [Flammula alnicola]
MTRTPSISLLSLPVEMLVEIISKSNSDTKTLLLVCRTLRDIVYSMPSMWSSIHIRPQQIMSTSKGASFLSKRLERTRSYPINVTIRVDQSADTQVDLWPTVALHRTHVRTLDISTDTVIRAGTVLHSVLLHPTPAVLPELRELFLRPDDDEDSTDERRPLDPEMLLTRIGMIFPALTSLALPLFPSCIPYLESSLPSLRTLVLDGTGSWSCGYPGVYQIARFLLHTPNLETFWCKEHGVFTHEAVDVPCYTPSPPYGSVIVNVPVSLARLTRMAVTVPGIGADLLHLIDAPLLEDLQMDGTRCDEYYGREVAWVEWFPGLLTAALAKLAPRAPALRRLAIIDAYMPRDTWEWLLGCDEVRAIPFPQLDSIALHCLQKNKGVVSNDFDNALLKTYSTWGRLILSRFAYLGSSSPLHGNLTSNSINHVVGFRNQTEIFL